MVVWHSDGGKRKRGKPQSELKKPLSPNNSWKIYSVDADKQATSGGLRGKKQEETFVSPQCDGISSRGLLLLLFPFSPKSPNLFQVVLQRGIMIIKHMNGAIKEPISALQRAFKGSGRDSEIRGLNSRGTFDDRPLPTVIERNQTEKSKAALLCSINPCLIFCKSGIDQRVWN